MNFFKCGVMFFCGTLFLFCKAADDEVQPKKEEVPQITFAKQQNILGAIKNFGLSPDGTYMVTQLNRIDVLIPYERQSQLHNFVKGRSYNIPGIAQKECTFAFNPAIEDKQQFAVAAEGDAYLIKDFTKNKLDLQHVQDLVFSDDGNQLIALCGGETSELVFVNTRNKSSSRSISISGDPLISPQLIPTGILNYKAQFSDAISLGALCKKDLSLIFIQDSSQEDAYCTGTVVQKNFEFAIKAKGLSLYKIKNQHQSKTSIVCTGEDQNIKIDGNFAEDECCFDNKNRILLYKKMLAESADGNTAACYLDLENVRAVPLQDIKLCPPYAVSADGNTVVGFSPDKINRGLLVYMVNKKS